MSYQNIADIISSSQNDFSYKPKDLVQNSVSKSSTSFEELVSFYKSDSNAKDPKTIESRQPQENNGDSVKEEKSVKVDDSKDSVNENDSVEKSQEKSEDVQNSAKDEKSEKTEKSEKDYKTGKVIKNDASGNQLTTEIIDNKKNNIEVGDKKSVKVERGENKKLSNKDFSRLHEITGGEIEENEAAKNVQKKSSKKIKSSNIENEKIKENEHSTNVEVLISAILTEKSSDSNLSQNKEKSSEDFISNYESRKEKKVFLDKDEKIEVQDLRNDAGKTADLQAESKGKMKVSEPKLVNENTATMTIELNNVNDNVLSSNSQTAAANGSNFQAMLNNQIQQSAPEFVKAGNLVLKDNNQGTINLVLRPDDLGNVKLHLSLDGKNISGHISVATKEALEVFKDNAETLREAFIKNGFDSASFDVSYSGNNNFSQDSAFEQQDGTEFIAKRVYENGAAVSEDDGSSGFEKNSLNNDYSINIVA